MKWMRRYRRYLPYPVLVAVLVWLRPRQAGGSFELDLALDVTGLLIALAGAALRFWAWGSNSGPETIDLRRRGPYAVMRHPLYVGNFLILCGMLIIFNNPIAYLIFLPAFVYMYHSVSAVEEQRMTARLGTVYDDYVRECPNRFLPSLARLPVAFGSTRPFNWRRAAKKEYESVLGWLMGAVLLDMYESLLWGSGAAGPQPLIIVQAGILAVLGGTAAILYLRRHGLLGRRVKSTGDAEGTGASGDMGNR